MQMAFGTRSEKEDKKLEREVEEVEKWMQSLIQA